MRVRKSMLTSLFLVAAAFGQATQPATLPATNPADAAAVKDALGQYNTAVANGDAEGIAKFIDATSDLQKKALTQMGKLTTLGHGLYETTLKQFGQAKLDADHVTKESFPGGFPQLPIEQIEVKTSGDAAVFTTEDGQPLPLTMTRKNGVWKFDGSMLQVNSEKDLSDRDPIITALTDEIGKTGADVTAGHFRSPDEVVVILQHRVSKVVRAESMRREAEEMPTTEPVQPPTMVPTPQVGPAAP